MRDSQSASPAFELSVDQKGHLRGLEESLLQSAVRKNAAKVAELLAEDFREFGSSGRVFSKAEILAALQSEDPDHNWSLDDFAATQLSESLVLVTYRAIRTSDDSPPAQSLRSSLWALRNGRWQMIFHQGTRIPPF